MRARARERSHSAYVVPIPGRTLLHGPAVLVHMVRLQWRATVFAGHIGTSRRQSQGVAGSPAGLPSLGGGLVGTLGASGGPEYHRKKRGTRAMEQSTGTRPTCAIFTTTTLRISRLPSPGRRLPRTFQNATADFQACKASHASVSC